MPTTALSYELDSAPVVYIQPSTGSHFLLKCLLLQITVVIFPALQLEWLWSRGNLPDTAFAQDEPLTSVDSPFYHSVVRKVRGFLMRTTGGTFHNLKP